METLTLDNILESEAIDSLFDDEINEEETIIDDSEEQDNKDKDNKTNKLVLKYIRKPYPIILEDLSSQGLTIEGYKGTGGSTDGAAIENKPCCELAEELHPEILQRAVELAKIFYQGEPTSVVTAGQRSE